MRILLPLVAVVALGALSWLAFADESQSVAVDGLVGAEEEVVDDTPVEPATVAKEPSVEPPAARTEVEAEAKLEVPEGQVAYRVRVVHGETKQPVAGATVSWLPAGFDYRALSQEDRNNTLFELNGRVNFATDGRKEKRTIAKGGKLKNRV